MLPAEGTAAFLQRRGLGSVEPVLMIPILHDDRTSLAIDKPAHWMLAPESWTKTGRNLQLAIVSSISDRDFWARTCNVKFLRFVHRLDAETTGVVLFGRSLGAVTALSKLFEQRSVRKSYLAVVVGVPKSETWVSRQPLEEFGKAPVKMRVAKGEGKPAETRFRVLQRNGDLTLLEAEPVTGRTHQIRVHLAAENLPILGDPLYGNGTSTGSEDFPMALRSVKLEYRDPFMRKPVRVKAPTGKFLAEIGFEGPKEPDPAPAPKPHRRLPQRKKPLGRRTNRDV
jgi:RluA family pseudouridine synthase